MEPLWMILLPFLVCVEAKVLTEVKVKLGQNVTLNCSVDISNIYWYMEIHNQFKVEILRTFSKTDNNPSYISPDLKTKYSVQENRLVITNVTAEDCRLYFCARKKNEIIHYEETIRLESDASITPTNEPATMNNQKIWESEPIMFSSVTLNAVLMLIIIGLLFTVLYLKRKIGRIPVNEPSPLTSEILEMVEVPQYEEIGPRLPPPAATGECIYYKAQLPLSTLPQHNRS